MYSANSEKKDPPKSLFEKDAEDECKMLSDCGYSEKAIKYYMEKPYMGSLSDADQVSEMIGSCGDTAKIFLKIDQNEIADIRFQILGCPGAISAAVYPHRSPQPLFGGRQSILSTGAGSNPNLQIHVVELSVALSG